MLGGRRIEFGAAKAIGGDMVTLREIMTRDVITISPEISIRDAMSLLSTRHISGAPVVAGGEIIGVVTATDLMAFAADLPGAPAERPDYVEAGEWELRDQLDNDGVELEPRGTFFTGLWDDAGADAAVRFATPSGPEWSALDTHTVEEAMTRAPIRALPPDTPLVAAAEFMRTHAIHRVLVTEAEQLLGIATYTDLARAIADHRFREREYVFGNERHGHPASFLGSRLPSEERKRTDGHTNPPGERRSE
jgi:CBS domain-containing protein